MNQLQRYDDMATLFERMASSIWIILELARIARRDDPLVKDYFVSTVDLLVNAPLCPSARYITLLSSDQRARMYVILRRGDPALTPPVSAK